MLRLFGLSGLWLLAACPPGLPASARVQYPCADDRDCTSGRCVAGWCVAAGSDASTVTGDAHVDATAGDAHAGDRLAADRRPGDIAADDRAGRDQRPADAGAADGASFDAAAGDRGTAVDGTVGDGTVRDGAIDDAVIGRDQRPTDRRQPDATPANFRDLQWAAPQILSTTVDRDRCETDPVVTSDLQWLYLTRPATAGADCYTDRRFHLFHWNNGVPTPVARLPKFEAGVDENNPHPVDGVHGGHPGWQLFVHTAYLVDGSQLRAVWLRGDPPATVDGAPWTLANVNPGGSPSLTVSGDRLTFTRDDDLYEATGSPPDGWGVATRIDPVSSAAADTDPAFSADGRVLVFVRLVSSDDYDLWVARRQQPDGVFDAPTQLPRGSGEINTGNAEMDAFITAAGDLLYMSNRSGTRRAYIARGFVP